MVSKAAEDESEVFDQIDLHKRHFLQTVQGLQTIMRSITITDEADTCKVELPPTDRKKLVVFDMDETLIHCVDDIEAEETDVVLEINFPGEETVYAGINMRPYIIECLHEANKHFQVVVFTASHQIYADAILDYIDPNKELI